MSLEWIDNSSYSRGERGTVPPTTWTTRIGGDDPGAYSISITCSHVMCRGVWVCHCPALRIDTEGLGMTKEEATAEQAQMAALMLVRKRLEYMMAALISLWPGK